MVPGGVGGSEEYVTRQLLALAATTHDDLTLFVPKGFRAAHPALVAACRTVEAPTTGRRREARMLVERTWLRANLLRGQFNVVHHAGGTVPGRVRDRWRDNPRHPVRRVPRDVLTAQAALPSPRRSSGSTSGGCGDHPEPVCGRQLAEEFGLESDRLVVAPNAVTEHGPDRQVTAEAVVRARYGLPGRIVLFPAITYRHKNHATLIAAATPLVRRDPTLPIVLTGGQGPVDNEVLELIRTSGAADAFCRPGRIPAEDLAGLWAIASVLAFPSRYEGFGIPVLEAMASGCPVIASNTTALPEAVGSAGLLVDPDDIAAWTAALDSVLHDAAVAADLRARGYLRAADFSIERSAAGLHEAYHRAAGGRI